MYLYNQERHRLSQTILIPTLLYFPIIALSEMLPSSLSLGTEISGSHVSSTRAVTWNLVSSESAWPMSQQFSAFILRKSCLKWCVPEISNAGQSWFNWSLQSELKHKFKKFKKNMVYLNYIIQIKVNVFLM